MPSRRPADVVNRLKRDFTALESEAQRVTNITDLQTQEGKLFVCVIADLFGKLVAG